MADYTVTPKLALSVREVAAAVGISQSLVWQEISSGSLESARIGDRRLITPSQLEHWLEKKTAIAKQRQQERARREIADLVGDGRTRSR